MAALTYLPWPETLVRTSHTYGQPSRKIAFFHAPKPLYLSIGNTRNAKKRRKKKK